QLGDPMLLGQWRNNDGKVLDHFPLEVKDIRAGSAGREVVLGGLLTHLPREKLWQDRAFLDANDEEMRRAHHMLGAILDVVGEVASTACGQDDVAGPEKCLCGWAWQLDTRKPIPIDPSFRIDVAHLYN